MHNEEQRYELIERYLDSDLKGEQLESFEKALASDNTLATEVNEMMMAREAIVDYNLLDLKAKMQTFKPTSSFNWKAWSAGGLLLVMSITAVLFWPTEEKVENEIAHKKEPSIQEETTTKVLHGHESTKSTAIIETDEPVEETPTTTVNTPPKPVQQIADSDSSNRATNIPEDTLEKPSATPSSSGGYGCKDFSLQINIDSKATCLGEKKGEIKVFTPTGGTPPYQYSLDADNYKMEGYFNNLAAGNYTLVIKDAKECVDIKDVVINQTVCGPDYVKAFNPDAGERWKIPYEGNSSGKLTILNRKGQVVYTTSFSSQAPEFWDGVSSDGKNLTMGYYIFELNYDNGKTFSGGLSIVR